MDRAPCVVLASTLAVVACTGRTQDAPGPQEAVDASTSDAGASEDAGAFPSSQQAFEATTSDVGVSNDAAVPETGTWDDITAPEAGMSKDVALPGADASDAGASPDGGVLVDAGERAILLPVAPTASRFAWQTLQTDFVDTHGTPCTGQVTIAVSDHAVCYENAAGQLTCAGSTYTTNYGSAFVPAGQAGVDQILLSSTVNTVTGNAICVHNTSNQIFCFGDRNLWGQFGNGSTSPSATWVRWGSSATFTRIATHALDDMCALDAAGAIFCAGNGYGATPVRQLPAVTATTFWEDMFAILHANDPTTFRASTPSECTIVAGGLSCLGPSPPRTTSGIPGTVVSGGLVDPSPLSFHPCWGDSSGRAWCAGAPAFTSAGNILYVATDFYTTNVCVVSNDGSIWCMGSNSHGELGTGDTNAVTAPQRVQPPGSVSVTCR